MYRCSLPCVLYILYIFNFPPPSLPPIPWCTPTGYYTRICTFKSEVCMYTSCDGIHPHTGVHLDDYSTPRSWCAQLLNCAHDHSQVHSHSLVYTCSGVHASQYWQVVLHSKQRDWNKCGNVLLALMSWGGERERERERESVCVCVCVTVIWYIRQSRQWLDKLETL